MTAMQVATMLPRILDRRPFAPTHSPTCIPHAIRRRPMITGIMRKPLMPKSVGMTPRAMARRTVPAPMSTKPNGSLAPTTSGLSSARGRDPQPSLRSRAITAHNAGQTLAISTTGGHPPAAGSSPGQSPIRPRQFTRETVWAFYAWWAGASPTTPRTLGKSACYLILMSRISRTGKVAGK